MKPSSHRRENTRKSIDTHIACYHIKEEKIATRLIQIEYILMLLTLIKYFR